MHELIEFYNRGCEGAFNGWMRCTQECLLVIELLLESGARVSAKDSEGYTPLHIASNEDHRLPILLLRAGASLVEENNAGETPEEYAELQGGMSRAKLHLLGDVRKAGGWRRFACLPRHQLLALRALRARGRAVAGPTTPPLYARLLSSHMPDGVLGHILGFWHVTRDASDVLRIRMPGLYA